jgi:hypothetical protein
MLVMVINGIEVLGWWRNLQAAKACPRDRVCCEYISELMTHGVPFHEGV